MKSFSADITYHMLHFVGRFPLAFHYRCSTGISWILSSILRYRKDVVYINLSRAYPEKSPQEIEAIACEFYQHFGEIIAEAIWFSGSDRTRIKNQNICTITNPQTLQSAYDNSTNVMVLTSHTGNWELYGGLRYYNTDPDLDYVFEEDHISMVYKRQSNKRWNEVLKRTRTTPIDNYTGLVESRQILRYALENKRNKKIYMFITDQRPYGVATDIGTFMNQHTYGMLAGCKLANKLHMPVLYCKMSRIRQGHYEMTYIPLTDDASAEKPELLLRKYFDELEKELNENPSNYLWSHKRWKE